MDLKQLIKTKSETPLGASAKLDICFGTSEVVPYAKTGGLGDVAASLPKALAARGHRVTIVMPLYGHLDPEELRLSQRLHPLTVPRKAKSQKKVEARVWETRFASNVRLFFIDLPEYFDRPGLYGYGGDEYDDNAERFAFFSRALVEFARQFSVPVDVLHCNDWHTALAPVYLDQYYRDELPDVATVLTLHNAAYQGKFPPESLDDTGLPGGRFLKESQLLDGESINFLKGGIIHSDVVTTVSPTYAGELRQEGGGFGLHDVLADRGEDLVGILNGADYTVWSPSTDIYIPVRYDEDSLNGKRRNKAELQHGFGLPVRPVLPLLGFIGRLTEQKGLDILLPALRRRLETFDDEQDGFQIVLLGEGEKKYEKAVEKLARDFPRRVAAHVGYSEEDAHQIVAGTDILLMPSHYEPCGLTQIYAMKYGTIPLVHSTGGLADTVTDADRDGGTGFVFDDYDAGALDDTIARATERYGHHRQWRPLMVRAMHQDFSWRQSALRYEELYHELAGTQLDESAADDEEEVSAVEDASAS